MKGSSDVVSSSDPIAESFDKRITAALVKCKRLDKDALLSEVVGMSLDELVSALNRLLKKNVIEVLRDQTVLCYQLKDQQTAEICKTLESEEISVFECVRNAGSKGIIGVAVKDRTGIPVSQVNKCLKELVNRNLVCAYSNKGDKTYVLASIAPDEAITGGIFYSDAIVDVQFVSKLKQLCYAFIDRKLKSKEETELYTSVSVKELTSFLSRTDRNELRITSSDVVRILEGLVHQGKIQKCGDASSYAAATASKQQRMESVDVEYRIVRPCVQTSQAVLVPCTFCPLIDRCRTEQGMINPALCVHLSKFTDF